MNWRAILRVAALLLVPMILSIALAWVAIGTPSFATLTVLNAFVAYPVFLALVGANHWLLRRSGKAINVWRHCAFALVLVSLVQFCVSYFSFRSYGQYQWQEVVVVSGGEFTPEGLRFLVKHALVVGLKYAIAVALYWAIFQRTRENRLASNQ